MNRAAAANLFVAAMLWTAPAVSQGLPPALAQPGATAPLPGLIDTMPGAQPPAPVQAGGGTAGHGLPQPLPASPSGAGNGHLPQPLPQGGSSAPARLPRALDAAAQARGDYPVAVNRTTQADPQGAGAQPGSVPQDDGLGGVPLGLIQPAWADAIPAPGQMEAGTVRFPYRVNATYLVRTRRAMPTLLVLPPCEEADRVIPGDEASFPWEIVSAQKNVVIVRADRVGLDHALHVISRSGRAYSFVVWAEDVPTAQVTDLKAFVDDDAFCSRGSGARRLSVAVGADGARAEVPSPGGASGGVQRIGFSREQPAETPASDFVRKLPMSAEDLSFDDIEVYAPDEASRVLAPVRVFHDGRRTYLDFGARLDSLRAPAPFLRVEGVDQPVDYHWGGREGQILVIHRVGDVTLKSGTLYLCLRNRWTPPGGMAVEVRG